jgi:hypothetical protein
MDRFKMVYLRTGAVSPTDLPYERHGIKEVLLARVRRFDRVKAEKEAQAISDAWTRFQLREFLKRNPAQKDWMDFCRTFVQVDRAEFGRFLQTNPETGTKFVEFYRRKADESPRATLTQFVQQVIGDPEEYVDVSKDGTGIYAKGGNNGYLMFKEVSQDDAGTERVRFGAQPVRCFQSVPKVKDDLCRQSGVSLHDSKLWRTNMLLHLPKDTPSGKQLVPSGYYYFGSISNYEYATLKPLTGGDNFEKIKICSLLENGLNRVTS